jgi:hypothetical protein
MSTITTATPAAIFCPQCDRDVRVSVPRHGQAARDARLRPRGAQALQRVRRPVRARALLLNRRRRRLPGRRVIAMAPAQAAQKLRIANAMRAAAIADCRESAQAQAAAGVSESEIARELGVSRLTVRSWLGKQ